MLALWTLGLIALTFLNCWFSGMAWEAGPEYFALSIVWAFVSGYWYSTVVPRR